MLKDKIEKQFNEKKTSHSKLTCQTHNLNHKIEKIL
jgi:hypothetical protein